MAHLCSEPKCPALLDRPGRCPSCQQAYEARRGTPAQRGYDQAHRNRRTEWAPKVATGLTPCWRCGELILPTEPWDLGHDDTDRTITRGPEHANRCNRAAAGRLS